MAPELERVDHIHVFVTDRAAAEQWYGRVLGLKRLPRLQHWAADGGPLTLGNPSDTIHIALFERPAAAKSRTTIALSTSADGLLAWQRHLGAELGKEPARVDHDVSWSIYFEDPDGNPFEITTYDYAALAGR
jgi:catechol-2,3-dioxygenase